MNRTSREILQLLRSRGQISRTDLARELGFTRMAIGTAVDTLMRAGILEPVGMSAATRRGRPSEIFQIAGNRIFSLGIAVNRFSIEMVILNWFHKPVAFKKMDNVFRQKSQDSSAAAAKVLQTVSQMMSEAGVRAINGGALAYSGSLCEDPKRKILTANDFLSVEQAEDFIEKLKKHLGAPIWLERDVDAALLAERWSAPDLPNRPSLFYVNDRLGFTMILDGRSWRGAKASTHWLGSVQVDVNGPAAAQFLPGSLFSTSINSIIDQRSGFPPASRPASFPPISEDDFRQIYSLYEKGDPDIMAKVRKSFVDLGLVLRNLTLMFSFDVIVLDGWSPKTIEDGSQIIHQLLAELSHADSQILLKTRVRPVSLGDQQYAVGAAISSIDQLLASRRMLLRSGGAKRGKTTAGAR